MCCFLTIVMAVFSLVFFTMSQGAIGEWKAARQKAYMTYAADAGLSEALALLTTTESGAIGSAKVPATFGGLDYWVQEEDLGDRLMSLVSTSVDGDDRMRIQLLCRLPKEGEALFANGIYGRDGVNIAGNSIIDSYHSEKGSYASQLSGTHAGENATVSSGGSIALGSGAQIFGDTYWSGDPADHAWISGSAQVMGTFDLIEDEPELIPIEPPPLVSSGNITVGKSVKKVVTGSVEYDSIVIDKGGSMSIVGPATLVVKDFELRSNGALSFDTSAGPITIYARSKWVLASNSTISTSSTDASQIALNLMTVHDAEYDSSPLVSFSSNGHFAASIYAPEAYVNIASNFELYGAVVARWFDLNSNSKFHYDEALGAKLYGAEEGPPEVLAWRPTTIDQLTKEGFHVEAGE